MDYAVLIMFAGFTFLGVWALVNPAGIIGWVKQAHPGIDEHDPSAHSIVRFIGAWLIIVPAVIFLVMLLSRYRP